MNKLLLTFTSCFVFYFSAIAQPKNFIDQPYIEVNGSADTLVVPNLIFIKITISEEDSKNKKSIEEQEMKMISAFNEIGINVKDKLSTSNLLSSFKSSIFNQNDIIKTKEYMLEVSTAEKANKVYIQLEKIGVSNAFIDRVDHTDIDQLKNYCRTKAIEDSHKKAITFTKPISQTIGNAIHISELAGYDDVVDYDYLRNITRFQQERKLKEESSQIDFEKIKISARVFVIYALE